MQNKKEVKTSIPHLINNINTDLAPPKIYQIWLIAGDKCSIESVLKVLIKLFYFDSKEASIKAIKAINGSKILCLSTLKDVSETKIKEIYSIAKDDLSVAKFIDRGGVIYSAIQY